MTVGFFDSGIGGISVLEKAAAQLTHNQFLFYADSSHVPYGTKSKQQIIEYVDNAVSFLHAQGADVVVLACNTATSAAANYLREKYPFPILGMEPAVKVASKTLDENDATKIIVTATELTLKLEKLESLIQRLGVTEHVEELSLQRLVEFAENDIFDGEVLNNYLKQQLSLCDVANTSALVLGCTHFTFYKTLIRRIMLDLTGHAIPVVDGNEGTVNHLASIVEPEFVDAKPLAERIRFFESDHEVPFAKYEHLLNRAHFENAGGY